MALPRCLALLILAGGGIEQCIGQGARPAATLESPFDFCARVGTDDRAGEGSGTAVAALAPYLHQALGLPPDSILPPNAIYWRCMDGKVYVCAPGANIPCDSKADRTKFNRGAAHYCRGNPDAPFVPAYATGHGTIYLWKCVAGHAERDKTVNATDHRGFRIDFWHLVER